MHWAHVAETLRLRPRLWAHPMATASTLRVLPWAAGPALQQPCPSHGSRGVGCSSDPRDLLCEPFWGLCMSENKGLLFQDPFISLWEAGVINTQTQDIQDVCTSPSEEAQHELSANSALPSHEPTNRGLNRGWASIREVPGGVPPGADLQPQLL